MKILNMQTNIEWLPMPNQYQLVLDDQMPPAQLITAALGLIFDGNRFLMTQLTSRGWDIPGGHIEPGETPEQTVCREIWEETRVHVRNLSLLGYDKFVIQAPKPPGYKYPHPISYQLFYWGHVDRLEPFVATEEALARRLFAPDEAHQTKWVQRGKALYEAALALATNRS
ncbi:MAG: NUDIX domain-containing protein [Caldilineaceae bacterium]|nr:NUDIX domain-containing protein [Caldilineaceae bacterium]